MKQYSVEVFDKNMDFKCYTIIDSIKFKSDYLDPEKYSIEVLSKDITDIEKQYFVHIINDSEEYVGIVEAYEEKKEGVLRIDIAEISSLFDLDVMIDVDDFDYTFEEYIKKWIDALYVTGDTSMRIPFEVSISSSTNNWTIEYDIENEPKEDEEKPPIEVAFINLFDDVILPAFTSHQIRLKYSVDINNKVIMIDIGKNTAPKFVIEADLPNIISKSVVIRKSTNETNKAIVYNQENYLESITYYLHSDGTFSTEDTDRIIPVSYKLLKTKKETEKEGDTEIVVKTFAEAAHEQAVEVFNKNKYTNLIELVMMSEDDQIHPEHLEVGQVVSVISDGNIYESILSGREINKTTKLIFGTVRLELTKKLKGRG